MNITFLSIAFAIVLLLRILCHYIWLVRSYTQWGHAFSGIGNMCEYLLFMILGVILFNLYQMGLKWQAILLAFVVATPLRPTQLVLRLCRYVRLKVFRIQ